MSPTSIRLPHNTISLYVDTYVRVAEVLDALFHLAAISSVGLTNLKSTYQSGGGTSYL